MNENLISRLLEKAGFPAEAPDDDGRCFASGMPELAATLDRGIPRPAEGVRSS